MGAVRQALDGQPRGRLCGRQRLGSQPGRRHPEVGRGRGSPLQAQGHAGPPAPRRLRLRRCKYDQPPLQARPTIQQREYTAQRFPVCVQCRPACKQVVLMPASRSVMRTQPDKCESVCIDPLSDVSCVCRQCQPSVALHHCNRVSSVIQALPPHCEFIMSGTKALVSMQEMAFPAISCFWPTGDGAPCLGSSAAAMLSTWGRRCQGAGSCRRAGGAPPEGASHTLPPSAWSLSRRGTAPAGAAAPCACPPRDSPAEVRRHRPHPAWRRQHCPQAMWQHLSRSSDRELDEDYGAAPPAVRKEQRSQRSRKELTRLLAFIFEISNSYGIPSQFQL